MNLIVAICTAVSISIKKMTCLSVKNQFQSAFALITVEGDSKAISRYVYSFNSFSLSTVAIAIFHRQISPLMMTFHSIQIVLAYFPLNSLFISLENFISKKSNNLTLYCYEILI